MMFECLTTRSATARKYNCGPSDVGACRPDACNPDIDSCGPDYGVDCMPECDPADDM